MSLAQEPIVAAAPVEATPTRQRTSSTSTFRRLLRQPVGTAALIYLVLLVAAVILAPVLAPYPPLAQDFTHVLSGPSAQHLLGTDQLGRDVLSRLLYGGRVTLIGVAETVLVAVIIGLVSGMIAGFLGGMADAVLSRLSELIMAVPAIVVLLMVFSLLNNNENWAMLTLGLLSVPAIFRVVRGAVLTVRKDAYVSAARITGVSRTRIMTRHILPRVYGPLAVNTSVMAALVLGIQTGLNFIGLGVTPPAPSWGGMVAEAYQQMQESGWLIIPSGLVIAVTILAFVLLGDAVRDAATERSSGGRVESVAVKLSSAKPGPGTGKNDSYPLRPETAPLLTVRDLSVAFPAPGGEVTVVRGIGFDVLPGEAIGIVGESGCGKSVTTAAILGLLSGGGHITGGHAEFDGRDLFAMTERERHALRGSQIGFVSQEPMTSLDPNFRVGSQLAEVIAGHQKQAGKHEKLSKSARHARVLELLAQVGLPDPADVARRYPHQISGGMAQRVAIASALAGRPRLLVADEPTTALDVTVQAEILDLLDGLRTETGMSIMLITHDLGVVADLCSRAVVMYAGEIVEFATVRELVHSPAHPYTKALLASNPALGERGQPLPAIPGAVPPPASWPTGCHFADRCPYRIDECTRQPIPLAVPGTSRLTRCLRSADLLAEATGAAEATR